MTKQRKRELAVRGSSIHYQFKNENFEFWFQWMLGTQTNGGSESGECFYAASRIEDGNSDSWVKEWCELGRQLDQRAEAALARGHVISAREAYLRAYSYYRWSRHFMSVRDPAYKPLWQKSVQCFREGVALLNPPAERMDILFAGKALPAYFFKPTLDLAARKTLIMIGGGDTFVEDLYFYIVPPALRRKYNVLIVDLPGQGGLPFDDMPMRPDAEAPMKAVIDYLLTCREVDPERLAVFGISGGGYLAPRAVTREPRLKACIASGAIPDFYEYMTQGDSRAERNAQKLENPLYKPLIKLMGQRLRTQLILIDSYAWRWGVNTPLEWLRALKAFTFDPRDIQCPLLILIGEAEYEKAPVSKAHQHQCLEKAASSKKDLIVTSYQEGAWGHALGTNLSLMSQCVFDWLDEVFCDARERLDEQTSSQPIHDD